MRSHRTSRAGDFDGGLTAGVQAILAATKGEYKGNGERRRWRVRRDKEPTVQPSVFGADYRHSFMRGSGVLLVLLSSVGM